MQGSLNLSDQCRNRGFLKLGALGARIVQLCTDRGNREPPVRQWPEKILDALSAAGTALKQASKILGFDYDRHPVMAARHVMVCARVVRMAIVSISLPSAPSQISESPAKAKSSLSFRRIKCGCLVPRPPVHS